MYNGKIETAKEETTRLFNRLIDEQGPLQAAILIAETFPPGGEYQLDQLLQWLRLQFAHQPRDFSPDEFMYPG